MQANILTFRQKTPLQKRVEEIEYDFEWLMDIYNYREYLIPAFEEDTQLVFAHADYHIQFINDLVKLCIENIFLPVAYTSDITPKHDISDDMEDLVEEAWYVFKCIKHIYFIMRKYSQIVSDIEFDKVPWAFHEEVRQIDEIKFYDRKIEEKLWFCLLSDWKVVKHMKRKESDKRGLYYLNRGYEGNYDVEVYIFRLMMLLKKVSKTVGHCNLTAHDVDQVGNVYDKISVQKAHKIQDLSMTIRDSIIRDNQEVSFEKVLELYYAAMEYEKSVIANFTKITNSDK
ncbi:hypothetical protein DYF89_25095 [Vibrio parahaemolyticus]|nr:hypothetical protein [Vibrio parahaemolyticus]